MARLDRPPKLQRPSAVSSVSISPSPLRATGKRQVGLSPRSSAFPWVRRPNSPLLLCSRPQAWGSATWRELGRWGLWEGERVHCFPASFPSPPEASCQKRSERRTWCSKKGRDQGVSQDPLREQQMKQSKPVSPRFH